MQKPPAALPPQPQPERRHDVKVSGSLARCPYCHEDVTQDSAWVACAECLARNHTECWDEGGRCASCSSTERLTREGQASPVTRYPRLTLSHETELPGRRLLGYPLSAAFKSTFDGALNPAGEAPWLAAEVRRVFKTKGSCDVTPNEVRWKPEDGNNCRMLKAKIASRNGQTTLEVEENFGSLIGLLFGLGFGGGLGTLSPLIAFALQALGMESDRLTLLLLGALALALVPLLIVSYRRIVARRRGQLEAFNQRLATRLTAQPPARSRPPRSDPKKDA